MMITASKLYLPAWLARLCLRASIEKGVGHKYVRREPTGDPKKPWRYFYNLTSGRGHLDTSRIREGAKFKIADGHVHVTSVDGEHAEVVHDETGETARMHVADLADLLHSHHGEEIERVSQRQQKFALNRQRRVAEKRSRRAFNLPRSDRAISTMLEEEIAHDFGTIDMNDQRVRDKIESIFPKRQAAKIKHFHDLVSALVQQARKNNEVKTWADLRDARLGGRRAGTDTVFDVIREIGDEIDDEKLKRATIPAEAQDEILRRDEEAHYRELYGEDGGDERDGAESEDGGDTSFDPEMFKSFRIPAWLAKALESVVAKAAGHKYLRRIPTGNPKRPWRYYYRVTGGRHLAHDDEIVEGAAFRAKDGEQEGHFHVVGVDGENVRVRHDESGREATMKREALRAMLHAEHIEKINAAVKWATETRDAAEKHGSDKQKARARKHAEGVVGAFVKPEPKAEAPAAAPVDMKRLLTAIANARQGLENSPPNMRDFYMKDGGGLAEGKRATEQHFGWIKTLTNIRRALSNGGANDGTIPAETRAEGEKARQQIQAVVDHAQEAIRAKKARETPKPVDNPAGAELPTFHLNGTSPTTVLEALTPAIDALSSALGASAPAAAPEPAPAPAPEAKPAAEPEKRAPRAKVDPDAPAPKTAKDLFERHGLIDTMKQIREGSISVDDLRAAFKEIRDRKDEIVAQLGKLTKDELAKIGGRAWSDSKKDQLVQSAWDGILRRFIVKDSFSWSPTTETSEAAFARVVNATTQADIDAHASKIKEQTAEITKRLEGAKNPKNLAEFQDRIRMLGGEHKLQAEERRRYDEFVAADAREKAEKEIQDKHAERAAFRRRAVETTFEGTSAKIIPGKHTKKGHDIFTVQLGDRVSGDDFKALSAKAKALGGYYSSFRGNGAIPGFIFETNEAAAKFAGGVGGGAPAQAAEPEPEEAPKLHGNGPERLRKQAETLTGRAEEAMGADRQTNTARRASMAAGIEARARSDKAIARTMVAIADGVESGELRHLWGVKTRAHLDVLEEAAQQAKYARIRASGNVRDDDAWKAPPQTEDADGARFPHPYVHKDNVRALALAARDLRGGKQAAARLLAHVSGMGENDWRVEGDTPQMRADLETVAELAKKAGKATFEAAAVDEDLRKFRRASEDMGIKSLPQFRAMLREYLSVRRAPDGESKLAKLKREIIGNKIPGYFPTPPGAARRVMELADVQPGMTVLEPSAGGGNLADAAKAAGGKVEVAEVNTSLREILREKGHELVAHNTLDHQGSYERVVMNPPFENGQDIDHVRHAFDRQLAPGGRLVAIVSRGAVERSDKKATAFREWLEANNAHVEELPDGSFAGADSERKTGVATSLIVVEKPSKVEKALEDLEKSMEVTNTFARIPPRLGALLWKAQEAAIEKGAGHKYLRRVPTGNPKKPYRYYYRVTGGKMLGHDDEMVVGASFAVKHGDQAGHFHVKAVDGDKITIEHDESGHRETVTRDALRAMLHAEHAEAIGRARTSAKSAAEAAEKHGATEKMRTKTSSAAKKLEEHFGEKKAAAKSKDIPDFVREAVKGALDTLARHKKELDNYRKLGGGGRYEAEVHEKMRDQVAEANEKIDEFLKLAEEKGIDGPGVLEDLGGRAAGELSSAAAEWLAASDERKAERAKKDADEKAKAEKKPEPAPTKEITVEPVKYAQPAKPETRVIQIGVDDRKPGTMEIDRKNKQVVVFLSTRFVPAPGFRLDEAFPHREREATVRTATQEEADRFSEYKAKRQAWAKWDALPADEKKDTKEPKIPDEIVLDVSKEEPVDDGSEKPAASLAQSRIIRLTGKTFDAREDIKGLGARWNKDMKAWEIKTADHNTMKGRSALSDALFRLKKRGVQHEFIKALDAEENETMDTIEKSDMLYSGEKLSWWMRKYAGTPFLAQALKIERESMEEIAALTDTFTNGNATEIASASLKRSEITAKYQAAKDALAIRYVKFLEEQAEANGGQIPGVTGGGMEKALKDDDAPAPAPKVPARPNVVPVPKVADIAIGMLRDRLQHAQQYDAGRRALELSQRPRQPSPRRGV